MPRIVTLTLMTLAFVFAQGRAEMIKKPVEYKDGETVLEGYLAFDDGGLEKRPGVLIVHEWWGLNDYAKQRADQLAALGYVAFAVDMYGKGIRTSDRAEAAKLSGQFKDAPDKMRQRVKAGLDVLAKHERIDPQRIAAIGYCFGGTTVLQLAYSGAPVAGVVSFHGGLVPLPAADAKNVKTKILVLHGADDPFIPQAEIDAFQKSLREARADWQMMYYGNAVHSFTNPAASGEILGAQYEGNADRRSWQHLLGFLREVVGRAPRASGRPAGE